MNRTAMITPRTLKGFRDYLPEAMIPRERLIETARRVYRSFGYSPIDTPALEHLEILDGKAGDETAKQMYRFQDHGGRDVGMRFDLTVPLARFAAQHINELGTPFKRYHIATVWRGENTQRGRYREFMQCDFDTIGTQSIVADIEVGLVINDLFRAIGLPDFTIHVNNRKVLSGFLERQNLLEQTVPILRALDKLGKIGPDKVRLELVQTASASEQQADRILQLANVSGSNDEVLAQLEPLVAGSEIGELGCEELRTVISQSEAGGVEPGRIQVDVSIARGLDYYTGTIFETFLDKLPGIGSVCSGGRYDNLADLYTKQKLPGIGASLGLDRLLAAMEELGVIDTVRTPADVLIPYFDRERLADYLKLAAHLRAAGIPVELYPEPRKLGQQLKYADKRGFRVCLIAGDNEFSAGTCQVKDMAGGESVDVEICDGAVNVIDQIRKILA